MKHKYNIVEYLAIVRKVEGGRGLSLFPRDLVHGGNPLAGSRIVLKVSRTTTTEQLKEESSVPGVRQTIVQKETQKETHIIMIEATSENLTKIRGLKNYANISCTQKCDDFVRAMNSPDNRVCAVNCDFRLKRPCKPGGNVVLELCNPQHLDMNNENDKKLMACHNQEIIGTDGDNHYQLGNGMIIWPNWLCWEDHLHHLKIIPVNGQIGGTHKEGRYFITDDDIVNIEGGNAEQEVAGRNQFYMTPADHPYACKDGFLHMEHACGIPKIPCECYKTYRDMYCAAAEN